VLAVLGLSLARLVDRPAEEPPAGPTPASEQADPAARSTQAWRDMISQRTRRQQQQEDAEREAVRSSVSALVRSLDLSGLATKGRVPELGTPDLAFAALRADPGVARIVAFGQSSSANADYAVGLLRAELGAFLSELPSCPPVDGPWCVSRALPGGIEAVPYILRQLDAFDTLPLLVEAFDSHKEAHREYFGKQVAEKALGPEPQDVVTSFGMMIAYACDYFLLHWRDDPARAALVNEDQQVVLDDYAQRRREGHPARPVPAVLGEPGAYDGLPGLFFDQGAIMDFAERFVQARGEQADAGT
jgi:hypothetical protein